MPCRFEKTIKRRGVRRALVLSSYVLTIIGLNAFIPNVACGAAKRL